MTWTRRLGLVIAAPLLACTSLGGTAGDEPTVTVEGLQRVKSGAGVLFIKPEHNLGGYDSFLVAPIKVTYKRGASSLPSDYEQSIANELHAAILAYLESGEQTIVDAPGPCVVEIREQLVDLSLVDLDVASSQTAVARSLGKTAVVVEFRDSQSGEVLLRFGQRRHIKKPPSAALPRSGVPMKYFRRTFDRISEDLAEAMIQALRSETALPLTPVRSECSARIGRSSRGEATE